MIACTFAVPGSWATRTGGYAYDRQILARLPGWGFDMRSIELPGSYPFPASEDLHRAYETLRQLPAHSVLLIDGLAFGVLTQEILTALSCTVVALVHHPLALETGLDDERRLALVDSERRALEYADHIIVTSTATAATLASHYAVSQARIQVAVPGTERAQRSRASLQHVSGRLELLAVGSLIPRKGYDILFAALAMLASDAWRLTVAGSTDRDPLTTGRLRCQIAALGLTHSIRLAGELDDQALAAAYDAAHVFVMPSHYEGYGMALTEAMAHGLAIITTTGGALAETAAHPAIVKVPAGSAEALADALATLMADPCDRRRRSDRIWQAAQGLPRWHDAAAIVARTLIRAAS